MVTWFKELAQTHAVAHAMLLLSAVTVFGLALGEIRFRGINLGISGVLFAGIILGHFGAHLDPAILGFVREFGLILFVFTIGMQVGPGFLDSLRRSGIRLNLLAALIVLLGFGVTAVVGLVFRIDMAAAAGLFAGATTNTPALGAAQQALKALNLANLSRLDLPALGYAASYPFGIMGIILAMLGVRRFFRIDGATELKRFQESEAASHEPLERINLSIDNPNLKGVCLRDLPGRRELGIIVSRLRHAGETEATTAKGNTVIFPGDILLAVGTRANLEKFRQIVGRESPVDLYRAPGAVSSRRVVVTRKSIVGKTLRQLGLNEIHDVSVTRLSRGEVEVMALPDTSLQLGDRLQVVGEPAAIAEAAKSLGDSIKDLTHTDVLSVFIGIGLGVLAGTCPLPFGSPSAPLTLGLAGGPLLVAIVLSRIGKIGPIVWHIPLSANLALRQLGIVLFLACVGLKAGPQFAATLLSGQGLVWMVAGAMITLIPLLIASWIARHFLKMNYLSLCGLLAGSMTDPPALAFATTLTKSEAPSVAYATVYPLTMFLRIIAAQLLVQIFC